MSITELATGRPETPPPPAPAEIQRGAPATRAEDIVRDALPPNRYQPATLTAVRLVVGQLLQEGNDEAVVRQAVRLWDARDDGGPGLIPHLMAEAAKTLNPTPNTTPTAFDRKTAANAQVFDQLVAEAQAVKAARAQRKELPNVP